MAIALNEYATKAFSEHPIALWSLDDDSYFISLVSNPSYRLFDEGGWAVSGNVEIEDSPDEPNVAVAPFPDDSFSMFSTTNPSNGDILEVISPEMFTFDQTNSSLNSFCLNFWLYQRSVGVTEYRIGYKYLNSNSDEVEIVETIPSNEGATDSWINFNITDPIPSDILPNSWFKVIIRVVVSEPVSPTQEYKFILNGLSIGQWSEVACYKNLGSTPISLSGFNFSGNVKGITADQYGLLSDNAYYLVEDNKLLADNNGLTLVYGSENSTNIYPSIYGNPSFIFPGKGMLHESGRYKEFTLEMWLTVDPSLDKSFRIIGPLDNDNGIYIKGEHISLVIENNVVSHAVKEWYRPILLHIIFEDDAISMSINGERVTSAPFDRENIVLPETLDWWGVYSSPDIYNFKIDCISVYPYIIPIQVAKKRFVWGEGVETLQFIDGEFSGTTAAMDFTTSNYDVNQIYPDLGRWDAGYYNNLSVNSTSISLPNYSLPERYLGGPENSGEARSINSWYDANKTINLYESGETFVTFRPNQGERFNYFYKPSVELLKWANYGSSTADFNTEYPFVGEQSLEIILDGEDTSVSAPHGFDDFEVPTTGTYWASAYFYIPEDPLQELDDKTITLTLEDGWGDATVLETNVATLNLGEWVRASIKFEVSDTVFLGRIVARISENINGQKLYTDAWMLEKTEELNQYFDGSTSQYANWVGSPYSSISRLLSWVPDGTDWTENSYFRFDWTEMFDYPVESFFGIFGVNETLQEERPLIHLVSGNRRLEINLAGDEVSYKFDDEEPFFTDIINIREKFVVGANIKELAQSLGNVVTSFFTSTGSVKMYVGGNALSGENSKTFEGKIYKVGVLNENNLNDLNNQLTTSIDIDNEWAYTSFFEATVEGGEPDSYFENQVDGGEAEEFPTAYFNNFGITEQIFVQDFNNLYTMYSLIPMFSFNRLFLDIELSAEWEEYYPLSFFATYVKDSNQQPYYDLDSLQLNLGYAAQRDYITLAEEQEAWAYGASNDSLLNDTLYNEYNNPLVKNYSTLDNEIITNYESYENLKRKAQIEKVFDFSKSSFFGYITFQFLSEGSTYPISQFINTKKLDQSRVIVADDVNTPSNNLLVFETKFEFTDNVVIYPPKPQTLEGADLSLENMVMVVHFNIQHKGLLTSPVSIRDFEICSRTSNETVPTEIGTKYGVSMYTYVKDGDINRYKEFNPVVIYKKNTPYLYTTSRSGIRVGNVSVGERQYGVRIPINESQADDVEIGIVQFWMKYDFLKFANNGISIMEVVAENADYEIVVIKDFSEERGIIKLRDRITKEEVTNALFYQNGVYVKNPIIKTNEWNSIGIAFLEGLSFDAFEGEINLLAGVTFNNISYYRSTGLGKLSSVNVRSWLRVWRSEQNPSQAIIWNQWYYLDEIARIKNNWKDVYILSESTAYLSTPEDIHKAYVGTNKQILDDDQTLSISNKDFSVINEASWSSISGKPV